jgi:septum formation protein
LIRPLILASASPQRRAILEQVGIPFEVRPANVEELTAGDPGIVAAENAMRKAMAVPGDVVLGADTIVAIDEEILGKPRDPAEAREFLSRLRGRTHDVIGGVGVVEHGEMAVLFHEFTRVTFRQFDEALIDWYVGKGEWEGRAGGYAIQGAGAALVAQVEGDYLNVVGLPLARLLDIRPELLETR